MDGELVLENVSKGWKDFRLTDVSMSVREGEHFIVLGPTGVGKTVLLEVIAGILQPDSGRILFRGKDITEEPPERRGFSYVPQNYALFPHMSVYDNIAYGLKIRRIPKREIKRKVTEIAEVLGVDHLLHRRPKTLSGGEQQRVALARALVVEPPLILLDEPFANLDVRTRVRLINEMRRWRKELGFTAIHVTHSFEEAVSLGDRVGVMLDGRLVQVGNIREVFSKPQNEEVARFLGFENIIEGLAEGRIMKAGGIVIELPFEVHGRIRVGLRPEDIILSEEPLKSSARNVFRVRVESVEELGPLVRVVVSAGSIRLRVFITRSSMLEMGIKSGKEVYASFKASALHVF